MVTTAELSSVPSSRMFHRSRRTLASLGPSHEALLPTPKLTRLSNRPQRRLLVLQTALKIVQVGESSNSDLWSAFSIPPRLYRSMTLSTRWIIGSGVFCGRCCGRCCDGEKGGVCGRVRAAGIRAPGETSSSGDVSGVTSCADLESIRRYNTTYVHACTNDASKCAAGMYRETMPDCDDCKRGAAFALP